MNRQRKYEAIWNALYGVVVKKECITAQNFCQMLKDEYSVVFSHFGNQNSDVSIYNYLGDISQECIEDDIPIITTVINHSYEPKPFHRLFEGVQYRTDEEDTGIIKSTPKKERCDRLKGELEKVWSFNWQKDLETLTTQANEIEEILQNDTLSYHTKEVTIELRMHFPQGLKQEILNRAKNQCENKNCSNKKSFIKEDGEVYLEMHHIKYYAQCKEEKVKPHTMENCVALCANCHRKAHYGVDRPIYENSN